MKTMHGKTKKRLAKWEWALEMGPRSAAALASLIGLKSTSSIRGFFIRHLDHMDPPMFVREWVGGEYQYRKALDTDTRATIGGPGDYIGASPTFAEMADDAEKARDTLDTFVDDALGLPVDPRPQVNENTFPAMLVGRTALGRRTAFPVAMVDTLAEDVTTVHGVERPVMVVTLSNDSTIVLQNEDPGTFSSLVDLVARANGGVVYATPSTGRPDRR